MLELKHKHQQAGTNMNLPTSDLRDRCLALVASAAASSTSDIGPSEEDVHVRKHNEGRIKLCSQPPGTSTNLSNTFAASAYMQASTRRNMNTEKDTHTTQFLEAKIKTQQEKVN